jgi:hypothetical protein
MRGPQKIVAMHSLTPEFRSTFGNVALALTLVMLWLLMHGYHGIIGDGQIYAFQAMARLHPYLASDLYLQNTSQDQFTLFSPLYAWCIGLFGLESTARILTLFFTAWLLAGVWAFARAFVGKDGAWAGIALLLITGGNYGGSDVFRILEPFLTARLPAQALIVTALYCQVRGMTWLGVALVLTALLIHPLMALPGLLLMISLWLPPRVGLIGSISGVIATLVICVAAVDSPAVSHGLAVMDAPWLEVVRERSQFLFLQLWSMRDWDVNTQPFFCLGFTAIVVRDSRIRRLCAASALVGGAGLVVQGQAWRWVWITALVSVVLLPFTAVQVARDDKYGLPCVLLLVLGYSWPWIGGPPGIAFASILWLARPHLDPAVTRYLRWASVALMIAAVVWLLDKSWAILFLQADPSQQARFGIMRIREILALEVPAILVCALIAWVLRIGRKVWVPILVSGILTLLCANLIPTAFKQPRMLAAAADRQKFADWAKLIPPTSAVLVARPSDVGAFVWFTLDRPNYLSLDQSAGVVFSRATALEVRRRSEVLLPLMDPDWTILSRSLSNSAGAGNKQPRIRPLTTDSLVQVCADPALGFVISPAEVGFGPAPHIDAGAFGGWNLYDCSKVRSEGAVI